MALSIVLSTGCGPVRTWDAHTTSVPPSFDVASLTQEPVAMFGVVAPAGLQGFGPALSHALVSALAQLDPPLPARSIADSLNAINEHGLASEYAETMSSFARSGMLERARLRAVGSAIGARYVLLPGIAAFDEVLADHFEITGLKIVRSRISTLRLWLQLWDARTGRMLWESSGEARVVSELVSPDRTVPFDETAQKLWLRMLREGLHGDSTRMLERRFR